MNIIFFDEESIKETAREWLDKGIALNLDDDLIELNEQFFEHIQASKSIGEYLKRESLNTHIGLSDDESSLVNMIVNVGYHRRGREVTLKIFDIYMSPELDSSTDSDYDEKYAECFIFLVQQLLQHSTYPGSATKMYARTDHSQVFLQQLHQAAERVKQELNSAGLKVEFEGKRWLAFRRLDGIS